MPTVQNILPAVSAIAGRIDWFYILKYSFVICAAVLILGGVLRLIFGRNSSLVRALSACITLEMIYLTAIALYVLFPQLRSSLTSLPFISVSSDTFYLLDMRNLSASSLYGGILQLFVLAFLINLSENLLPQGKRFLSWYGWRLLTVLVCFAVYASINSLVQMVAPEIFGEWAVYILVGMWAFILLTGLLKVLMSVVLAVINPIVGALYAFFFSNLFGKQLSKAIATTVLAAGLLTAFHKLGLSSFPFASFSLAAYGPVCLIAIAAVYLFGKML